MEAKEMRERSGQRLQALRLDRGITCRKAAEGIGVAEGTLRKMELGVTRPHVRTQVAVAKFYGVKPSTIWFANETVEPEKAAA